MLLSWYRKWLGRQAPASSRTVARSRRKPATVRIAVEGLEERVLLTIPINGSSWTALGPADSAVGIDPGGAHDSGRVTAIAPDPTNSNIVYVGAAGGGVWKTLDGGQTWAPLTDSQVTDTIGAIAVAPSNPSIIYAGTGEGNYNTDNNYGRGLLKSTDGGATWALIDPPAANPPLPAPQTAGAFDREAISKIVVDPANPNTVYVAVTTPALNGINRNNGVYRSLDGGATWTNISASIPGSANQEITDLALDPTSAGNTLYIAIGTINGNAANGVYKSSNATTAANFALLGGVIVPNGTNTGRITIAEAPSAPNTIYVSEANPLGVGPNGGTIKGFWASTDGGTTWATLSTPPQYMGGGNNAAGSGWYDTTLIVSPSNPNLFYAGGAGGAVGFIQGTVLNFALPAGAPNTTYAQVGIDSAGNGPHAAHHAIAFNINGQLLDGNDGGVWRLDTVGANPTLIWTDLNGKGPGTPGALNITETEAVAINPFDATDAIEGSLATSTAQYPGSTASVSPTPWNVIDLAPSPPMPSADGGTIVYDPVVQNQVYHVIPHGEAPPSVPGIANFYIRKSTDDGATWAGVIGDLTLPNSIPAGGATGGGTAKTFPPLVIDPANHLRLLTGTKGIYESQDGGGTWHLLANTVPQTNGWNNLNNPVDSIAIGSGLNGSTPYPLTVASTSSGPNANDGRLYANFNLGASWINVTPPGAAGQQFNQIIIDGSNPALPVIYVVSSTYESGGKHIWMSTNIDVTNAAQPVTWADISGNLPDQAYWSVAINPGIAGIAPTRLFIGGDDGVYSSTDFGQSWATYGAGLPHAQAYSLSLVPGEDILGVGIHGRGVWEIGAGETADLGITKTVDFPFPQLNQNVNFTITVTNAGPFKAQNVTVTDLLPAGLSFVVSNPSQGSYDPVSGIWSAGSIAVGGSATLVITAKETTTALKTNTATVTSTEIDNNQSNNTASVSVETAADIVVTKTVDNPGPLVGQNVTFLVTATNNGPDIDTNVAITDLLPAGLQFVSSTVSPGTTYNPPSGIWNIGTLTVGTSLTLTVTATMLTTSLKVNTATLTSGDDVHPFPAHGTASATVETAGDLVITKTDNRIGIQTGNNITYFITVSNLGPSPDVGVNAATVTDIFPAGLLSPSWTAAAFGGATVAISSGTGSISTTVELPVNGYVVFTVTGRVGPGLPGGQLVNTASVTPPAAVPDPNLSNNSSTDVDILSPPILVIGGDGGTPEVKVFDATTMTVKFDFFAYPFTSSGVRVAVGDVNGDGFPDIITAPGPGWFPEVKVFDGQTGALIQDFFAYTPMYTGGVFVAAGDVNRDGFDDIITGTDVGAPPEVKLFGGGPLAQVQLRDFLAYSPVLTGGVRVGAADVNGDGYADIITGAGPGWVPEVKVYSGLGVTLVQDYLALSPSFAGGIFVAGGDVNGDGYADVIVGEGVGGQPLGMVYSGAGQALLKAFMPYPSTFQGGLHVAALGGIGGNLGVDIAIAPGALGASGVQIHGTSVGSFGPIPEEVLDGSSLSVVDNLFAYAPFSYQGTFIAGSL